MINAVIIIPEITKGMKSIGSKALLKIRQAMVIDYQIDQLLEINKNINISIITGFDNERITKHIKKTYSGVNVLYNENYAETNQVKCLSLLLEQKKYSNLLIISSGILFKKNSIKSLWLKDTSKIFLLDKPKVNFNIGCIDNGTDLEYLFYDLPVLWSECVFLNKEAMITLRDIIDSPNIEQMFLFEIINQLISRDIIFDKVSIKKNDILKICNLKDLAKAKSFI